MVEAVQTLSEYELERGKPMPSKNHAAVQGCVIVALSRYDEKYSVFPELSLELDGTPYVPDVSVYPRDSLDPLQDTVTTTDPPLLVIEILSPSQPFDDVVKKAASYLKAGVKSCWIVQPAIEGVTVLLPGEKPKFYTGGDVTDAATGITVAVEDVFRPFH
ncbi:MAG TPA: Uma2 family endonuclease [Thermoanaerobaculia bacterium]